MPTMRIIFVGLLSVSQVRFLKTEHAMKIFILNREATVLTEMMLCVQAGKPFVLLYFVHRTWRSYMKLGQPKLGFTSKINRICYHFSQQKNSVVYFTVGSQ